MQGYILADRDEDGYLDPSEYALTQPRSWTMRKVMTLFTRKDRDVDSLLSPKEYGVIILR
ncbi:MAG: hypothetical protein QM755_00320 [Luteolibacter sp.]